MELPAKVAHILQSRGQGVAHCDPCRACNAYCCTGPGFALLENVLEIYQQYETGKLVREDYRFEEGLSLCQFIWRYFDRGIQNGRLLTFFPKTLLSNFDIVSVAPDDYYRARASMLKQTDCRGCVFLSRRIEGPGAPPNHCILHSDKDLKEVTSKPIDCVFLRCVAPREILRPSQQESNQWIDLLDSLFPNSLARFRELCPDMPDQANSIYPNSARGG